MPQRLGHRYAPIVTTATYSPWNRDAAFLRTWEAIQGYTMVDPLRCWELWTLVAQSAKLPAGSLIEVGTWRGGTGALIAQQAHRCGIPATTLLCDTFRGVVKAGAKDTTFYHGGEHADCSRKNVEELCTKLALPNVTILEGIFPDETGAQVAEHTFRFCHLDVDVYDSAKDCVEWLWGRLVPGGIMVYDDYGFWSCDGITKCVNEQQACSDRLVLYNINGHAVVIKLGIHER